MAGEDHIKNYTATDIERYHKGLLSAAEMNAIERASLEDPFLADALDGYAIAEHTDSDRAELKLRLEERVATPVVSISRSGTARKWLRAAVLIAAIAGAAFLTYQVGFNEKRTTDIADNPAVKPAGQAAKENNDAKPADSSSSEGSSSSSTTRVQTSDAPATEAGRSSVAVDNTTGGQVPGDGQPPRAAPISKESAIATKDIPEVTSVVPNKPTAAPVMESDRDDKKTAAETDQAYLARNKADESNVSRALASKKSGTQPNALRMFRGRVTDPSNNALPFANVTNTQDNVGTYTDAQGYFTLVSPDSVLNVQVKSLGFENRQAQLNTIIPNNQVVLREENQGLDAFVMNNRQANTNRARSSMMVLEEPEPADGWTNYDTYIVNNLRVPDQFARRDASHGEVELSVEVNDDGDPVKITVTKSLCESCDREAIRLVMNGPKWKKKGRKGTTIVKIPF